MNSGKIILGVLVGVATGALIGVLFAPEKGAITRKKIKRKADDTLDDLKDKMNEFLEKVESITKGDIHAAKAIVSKEKARVKEAIEGVEV